MRESRLSGSVEGVRSNPDPYSDSPEPLVVNNQRLLASKEPALLSRWEKLGRGGTEDETVKPLDGVQRVQVPHGQSEQAGR
jgi:hypothetical protein